MRRLVTVRTVGDIHPIPNADAIEVISVDGWELVSKKGEFQSGDDCVFFEIDSFLPAEDERYSFLRKSGVKTAPDGVDRIRLKTIKLRGQISQGLALPVGAFPEIDPALVDDDGDRYDWSDVLGVTKYERPEKQFGGNPAGTFPHFIQKTDEDRVQNCWQKIVNRYPDVNFIPTMKLDGSSCTVAYLDDGRLKEYWKYDSASDLTKGIPVYNDEFNQVGEVIICSRNQQLIIEEENHFVKAVYRQGLIRKVEEISAHLGRPIAIQGEVMGPGIQGNQEQLEHFDFFAFNIYDILNMRYMSINEAYVLFAEYNIQCVPILEDPFCPVAEFSGVQEVLRYAEGPSISAKNREGVVFKSVSLDNPVSFKAISNRWLIKNEG